MFIVQPLPHLITVFSGRVLFFTCSMRWLSLFSSVKQREEKLENWIKYNIEGLEVFFVSFACREVELRKTFLFSIVLMLKLCMKKSKIFKKVRIFFVQKL
jgi:hypothetical protein